LGTPSRVRVAGASQLPGTCPIIATSVTTAELIKQAANSFLATKISFINMVSDLCDELGVDAATVARDIGLDPRIGSHFLNAGLGFGGSCLPKDLSALIKVAEDNGVDVGMLREVARINTARVDRLLAKVERALWVLRNKVIAVFGVAFKPDTDDIRRAPGRTRRMSRIDLPIPLSNSKCVVYRSSGAAPYEGHRPVRLRRAWNLADLSLVSIK
jgi:nucleotide sugar dehydrogenase